MTPSDPDPRTRYAANGHMSPTADAIAAYRAWSADRMFVPPPTVAQVRLLAQYLEDYCDEWKYTFGALPELRRRVVHIRTATDLADWLAACRQMARLEPL